MTQIEILKKNIQEAEAIIVGGASGLSAAAGFRFYYIYERCHIQTDSRTVGREISC